jgi:hypothetical protein
MCSPPKTLPQVLNETAGKEPNSLPIFEQAMDLTMLAVSAGGRERTLQVTLLGWIILLLFCLESCMCMGEGIAQEPDMRRIAVHESYQLQGWPFQLLECNCLGCLSVIGSRTKCCVVLAIKFETVQAEF